VGQPALHRAAARGDEEIVEDFLAHGTSAGNLTSDVFSTSTPLHFAAASCNSRVVEIRLDHRANISADVNAKNAREETPLFNFTTEIFHS
jgi:ankyrin repeat protein